MTADTSGSRPSDSCGRGASQPKISKGSRGWPIAKRAWHWSFALAVVVALLAPKPPEPNSMIHIVAGTIALALGLTRLVWRGASEIRPRLRDGLRLTFPSMAAKGVRALALPASQLGRLTGFILLGLVTAASGLGVLGLTGGGENAVLETHETLGEAIKFIVIAHVALTLIYAYLIRMDLLGVTLTRSGALGEGGQRGMIALLAGLAVGILALGWIWGPYSLTERVDAFRLSEDGGRDGDHHDEDD